MRKTWVLTAAVVLVAAVAIGSMVALSGGGQPTPVAQASVNTATVDRGKLSDMVSQYGILTYRAQSDSPYAVINRVGDTYTELPVEKYELVNAPGFALSTRAIAARTAALFVTSPCEEV